MSPVFADVMRVTPDGGAARKHRYDTHDNLHETSHGRGRGFESLIAHPAADQRAAAAPEGRRAGRCLRQGAVERRNPSGHAHAEVSPNSDQPGNSGTGGACDSVGGVVCTGGTTHIEPFQYPAPHRGMGLLV
jgi:hypothetical protein